ncbi:MAG TPA: carbon monoxide dehydrogenase subunit G [Symbiobacteriaceae bacterium]|nr:carbon monoxide dehydrogenase subunit G [Symbiobacteriaceae bacterium]
MQIAGTYRFQAARPAVWAVLTDETALARCLPGCKELVPQEPGRYRAVLEMGLAAVKGKYDGTLTLLERDEPSRLTIQMEAGASTGWVKVTGAITLSEDGPAATAATYNWAVQAGGPVAMVGQRVLGGVAKWVVGEFFAAAAKELAGRQPREEELR